MKLRDNVAGRASPLRLVVVLSVTAFFSAGAGGRASPQIFNKFDSRDEAGRAGRYSSLDIVLFEDPSKPWPCDELGNALVSRLAQKGVVARAHVGDEVGFDRANFDAELQRRGSDAKVVIIPAVADATGSRWGLFKMTISDVFLGKPVWSVDITSDDMSADFDATAKQLVDALDAAHFLATGGPKEFRATRPLPRLSSRPVSEVQAAQRYSEWVMAPQCNGPLRAWRARRRLPIVRVAGAEGLILPEDAAPLALCPCMRRPPRLSIGHWTPTETEIAALERALPSHLHEAGWGASILSSSRRQYLGVVRQGRREIYVNFFPKSLVTPWRSAVVRECKWDSRFFGVTYDVGSASFTHTSFQGTM